MKPSNRELWYAALAILVITLLYLYIVIAQGSIPAASDFFGHSLGILGFLLMVMTETLYTFRKRSRRASWGKISNWLKFHIFTGLVGPYLVLLHTSWKFNGLAGVVTLLTGLTVLSGFIGRYIYTAVPRAADGLVIEARVLQEQIARTEAELEKVFRTGMQGMPVSGIAELTRIEMPRSQLRLLLGRRIDEIRHWLRWRKQKRALPPGARQQLQELENLVYRRRNLHRQVASLAVARRMLALWHAVHIPIGMALFTLAIVHIVAAFYYATLLQ